MMKYSFLIILFFGLGPVLGQTTYDGEYAQVCLIDSIAPDTINQFWRLTQANNPGEFTIDMSWDMETSYTVSGTVLPCCSCLTEATAMSGPGGFGDIASSNPAPINALLLLSGLVLIVMVIPPRKVAAVLAILAFPFALSAQNGQGTTYDIEYSCICLVDSIASDTIIQFWRFTQANNPGEYTVDVTFDFSTSYTPSGEVLSCKDYYLGDNPGGSGTANTLAMWTGPHTLGNSSVTQSGQILATSLTGAFHLPLHTTAGRPAGVSGYVAYNSTENGLEGYNGGNYYFLPWASADNFSSTRIPYSDGNQLTSTGNLTWDNTNGIISAGIVKSGDTFVTLDIRQSTTNNGANVSIGSAYDHGGATAVTTSVAVGSDARITGTNPAGATAIGAGAYAANASTAIGQGANCSGQFAIALGRNTTASQSNTIAIGNGASATAVNKSIAIGGSASNSGQWSIVLGAEATVSANNSILIGSENATVAHAGSIVLGSNTSSTADGQFIAAGFKSGTTGITNVFFGSGVQRFSGSDGAGVGYTIHGSGARGTDFAGGDITVAAGKGTGAGAPGIIIFSTSTAGSSGSSLQSLTERARFNADGRLGIGTTSPDSELEVVGKAKITSLPDSLYRYEVRADINGRFSRQEGAVVGAISTSTDGSGDIVVPHGMSVTPTSVQVTVTGTTPYVVTVHTIGATNFTVRFFDMAGAAVTSTAVTATWYAKT